MSFIAAKSFALDGSRSSSLEKRHKIKSPNHATQESSGSIFRFTSNELNRMKQKLSEFSEWQEDDNFFDGSFDTGNHDSSPNSTTMNLNLLPVKKEYGLSQGSPRERRGLGGFAEAIGEQDTARERYQL